MPQDVSAVTYAPKLKKEDGRVSWIKPADWISRQVRAFNPWPGTFTTFENMALKFWAARAGAESTSEPPGKIIKVTKESVCIAAGAGSVLEVLQVQPENRPRMTAHDFAIGHRVQEGKSFS